MMTADETGRWLTVEQVAEQLQVHVETVRRWIRAGEFGVLDLGSRSGGYRIRQADLDEFVSRRFRAAGNGETR